MEDLKEKTRDLADHVEDLAETFYRLTTVKVTQKATDVISGAIIGVLLITLALFFLFFAGFALGWWMGDLVNSRAVGFLLAAAFFLLVFVVIVMIGKKTILPMLRDIIVRKFYD